MSNDHRSDWPLRHLPPVDFKEDDVIGAQGFAEGAIQYASFQGERDYQEDRFVLKSGAAPQTSAEAKRSLADMFHAIAKDTRDMKQGSTATLAMITPDHHLNVAYLGDSPLMIITRDPNNGDIQIEAPLRPHQAKDPQEQERIEDAGGTVLFDRIDGALALSRAFGDAAYLGVSTDIETYSRDLSPDIQAGREVYVCIGSDGLTEASSPQSFSHVLNAAIAEGKQNRLAEIFATYAYQSGSTDNITAMIAPITPRLHETIAFGVCDGHGGHETADVVHKSFSKLLNP